MCSILVVEDDTVLGELMSRWCEQLGHDVRQAASSDEAVAAMTDHQADIAVCDVNMPGRNGVWLAGQLRQDYPCTAVIMATGNQDPEVALASLREGAVDFLAKPFAYEEFREALARGVQQHRAATQGRQRLALLQREVREYLAPLEQYVTSFDVASDADLDVMMQALIPERDAQDHAQRVAALATNLAVTLGIRSPELSEVQRAARLHDLARVAIPTTIVCKAAPLSAEELAIVRQQPSLVCDILKRNAFLAAAAAIVRAIFEHVDGTGYPWALRGEEIPMGARIVAVGDALDTMTHHRVYRRMRTPAEAVFEIQRCRGSQFDDAVVDALLKVVRLHWSPVTKPATTVADRDTAIAYPSSN